MTIDDFLPEWGTRNAGNRPYITARLFAVMGYMKALHEQGVAFVCLAELHKRTINALIERDWIVPNKASGDVRYKLTGRGLKDYTYYATHQPPRLDGICPTCGVHPKHIGRNGTQLGYCIECNRKHNLAQVRMKGHQRAEGALCPRCKKRPLHRWATGRIAMHCRHCLRIVRRAEKKRKIKRLKKQLQTDNPPLCIRCKAAPRYSTPNTVYDYCHGCYREMQNAYVRRRAQEAREGRDDR